MARAKEVQGMLSAAGKHRGVPPADLIIAVAAELSNVPVLHYDHDYG
jgi:predicted nucleic acid-binding protein